MEGRLGSSPSHRSSAVVLGTLGVAENWESPELESPSTPSSAMQQLNHEALSTWAANMCDGSPLSDPYDTASPSTLMDPSLE